MPGDDLNKLYHVIKQICIDITIKSKQIYSGQRSKKYLPSLHLNSTY